LPIEGVTSEMLLDKMKLENKQVMTKEALFEWASKTNDKLIVMAGAGDIDACITKVKDLITKN
jgi:UDP-N-acetylmuramate--alanine ligase